MPIDSLYWSDVSNELFGIASIMAVCLIQEIMLLDLLIRQITTSSEAKLG